MIHATLIPAAIAALAFGGSSVVPVQKAGDYEASFSAPQLCIEGEPYEVSVVIRAVGEKPCEMPAWLLTPAAWLVDNKPLQRREAEGRLGLQPGQSVEMTVDLSGLLAERFDGDPRDFRLSFAESGVDSSDVIYLGLPERGINFEELPKEQLGNYQVVLQTTEGAIWLEMWPDVAPNHVRNFLDLASEGFYDGSPFHRVIPTFMVQGGRAASGEAAPRKINAEFNSRTHEAGVLSAARLGNDINSAASEFFIVHRRSPHLDGKYSAFGKMISGMDTLEKVVSGVEIHYELINRIVKRGVTIDVRNPLLEMERDRPNPAKGITQALVVRATKSRPKAEAGKKK